jgi:YVTN family beta-propeller protein
VIDLATNAVTGSPITVGNFPTSIAITPDGSRAYVVNTGSQSVSVIDTATNAVTGPAIPVSSAAAIAIAPDGGHAYVVKATNPGGGVAVISTVSNSVIGSPIPMDGFPGHIAISPDGTRGLVAGGNSNRVRAFDTTTNAALGTPIPPAAQGANAIAITPDQGPVAAFSVSPASAGTPAAFDGSASGDADGTVARYDWNFGDGTTLADGGPSPTHTYSAPGTYAATLTVTDNEGCSTQMVFTGQTAHCNAGSPARAQQEVVVSDPTPPPDTVPPNLTVGGRKSQKLDGAVEVTAACDEACSLVATGTLVVKGGTQEGAKSSSARKRFKLKKTSAQIGVGQSLTLKLKLPFRARLGAAKALAGDGKVKAKVAVTATDAAGNAAKGRRTVVLKPKH